MILKPKKLYNLFEEKVYTVSNMLSLSRVLLLPVFLYFIRNYATNPADIAYLYYSIITLVAAVLTDYMDGLFARLMKQQSALGRYLDPICDKITTIVAMVIVVYYFEFPLWLLIAYVIREIYAFYMGGFLYFKRGIQGRPNWWGKFGVGFVAINVFWYVYLPYWRTVHFSNDWTMHPEIAGIALVVILVAGMISYARRYWKIVFYPERFKTEADLGKSRKHFDLIK